MGDENENDWDRKAKELRDIMAKMLMCVYPNEDGFDDDNNFIHSRNFLDCIVRFNREISHMEQLAKAYRQ